MSGALRKGHKMLASHYRSLYVMDGRSFAHTTLNEPQDVGSSQITDPSSMQSFVAGSHC